ncbi:hypothetical protein [Carboxylicivirga sp. RSCT41]|uniref:hypothetical protein n=1 Tax=Carboxylicivirga agarovorans TaxID=3417570 RepID=UPI003D351779
MTRLIKISILGMIIALPTTLVKGQSTQLFSPADSVARLEMRYLHPFYKLVDKQGMLSGVYDFSISYPINSKWNIQASVPLLFAKYDVTNYYGYGGGYGYGDSHTVSTIKDNAIGNIMLGINANSFFNNSRVFSFNLQLFLPTAQDDNDAVDYAVYANLYELQKYFSDVTSVTAKATYAYIPGSGLFYSLSSGAVYLIAGSDSGFDNDFCLSYAFSGGYKINKLAFGIDYLGFINLTNDVFDDFRDRMFDALTIGAHYSIGNFEPSLFYSVYTRDDIRDVISGTLGIKLAYRFAR